MSGNDGLLSGINKSRGPVLVTFDQPITVIPGEAAPVTTLIDVDGDTSYYGFATPGTATSAAGWKIQRQVDVTPDTEFRWADGDKEFDNVWDDRATLSYP